MTEKFTRLVTPKGSLPDLEAIERHLSTNARRLGSVLVQEVITYTEMNDPEYVPVLKVGALRGSNHSSNLLELNVGGSAVKLPRGEKPLGVGAARIVSFSGIVYEDLRLIEEWDALFEHYSKLLNGVEPEHMNRLDSPPNISSVAVFKRECADMLHFLDKYGFSRDKKWIYVPNTEN